MRPGDDHRRARLHSQPPERKDADSRRRQFRGHGGGGCVEAEVWDAAREAMDSERPRKLVFNLRNGVSYETGLICGELDIYVEPFADAGTAAFGGGHISKSICRIASLAGFETTVIDDRESFANAERFPDAQAALSGEYESLFESLNANTNTYIVIVTRGHRDDMRILRWAVTADARYVAMVGSKRKVISTVKELEKEGMARSLFERLHAPMGLDIGAITPEEIAVSVVAEMIAARRIPDAEWSGLSKSIFAREEMKALLK